MFTIDDIDGLSVTAIEWVADSDETMPRDVVWMHNEGMPLHRIAEELHDPDSGVDIAEIQQIVEAIIKSETGRTP